MDFKAIWRHFLDGSTGTGTAAVLGLVALAAGTAFMLAVIRPLVRVLSRHDTEKAGDSRRRRARFGAQATAVTVGLWVFFQATTLPGQRAHRLPYQASEMLAIIMAGYLFLEIVLSLFADFLPQQAGRPAKSQFFKDVVRALALIAIALVGLKIAFPATDVGQLVTTSAILSIVIGLALQESLSNVFSGLILTVDEPFKPGDWIDIDGKEGKVLDSNWRSIRVLTRDDDVIYVPNSTMAKNNVTNFSAPTALHLLHRRIGVEYGAPPNRVRQVLNGMLGHIEGVLPQPPPDTWVVDYGDFAITYEMRFWIDKYGNRTRIESEVMRAVWYHLKRNNIGIPFPIREVYLKREKPATKPEETVALLRKVDILAQLKDDEARLLADDLTSQLFAKGEVVCRQGDEGAIFYIIKSGKISVHVKSGEGTEAQVAELGAGAYFGEMSLLTGEPRSSTCKASEDSELLCLDRESFGILLKDNPPIAQTMSEVIAMRSMASKEKLAKERDTMVHRRAETDEKKNKIFEAIRTMFRFR